MAYFHCRTQIRIRIWTQIPVPCRYYGKGIWGGVSGNVFCIILCSYRVWNPNPSPNLNPSPAVEMSHNGQKDSFCYICWPQKRISSHFNISNTFLRGGHLSFTMLYVGVHVTMHAQYLPYKNRLKTLKSSRRPSPSSQTLSAKSIEEFNWCI